MKNLFLLLTAAIMMIGCSKGGDGGGSSVKFNSTSLSLNVGETHKLFNGTNMNVTSSNNFVATLTSSGTVTAKHVGSAIVKAGDSKCTVSVVPIYNLYATPYMNWGASKSTVKSKLGTPDYESEEALIYNISSTVDMMYMFLNNGKLTSATAVVSTPYFMDLTRFLLERYELVFHDVEEEVFTIFADAYDYKDASILVGLSYPDPDYYFAMYIQANAYAKSADIKSRFLEIQESLELAGMIE